MAQTYKSVFLTTGLKVDYTPSVAVAAGEVVVQGSLLGIAPNPIAANALGSLHVAGLVEFVKINGALTAGQAVYWDANGDPQGGTAGTGGITGTATGNIFAGYVAEAAGATDETVKVVMQRTPGVAASALQNSIADPGDAGAIPVVNSGNVEIVTAGAETRTIAAPTHVGQQLLLAMKTDGGDCVITVATTVNQAGNNTITLNDPGDACLLTAGISGGDIRWRLADVDGAVLSTV